MNDIITVEDWNSALLSYPNSFEYPVDTKGMELDKTYIYDFVEVKVTYGYDLWDYMYKYEFKFYNEIFGGEYYLLNENGVKINAEESGYSKVDGEHQLVIYSTRPNIKLMLILNGISLETPESVGCIVTLKDDIFLSNFTKRIYEFNLINYDNRKMVSFELRLYTIDDERITLSPTRTEGSIDFKTKVIFEYTPSKLLKDNIEFIINRGDEVIGYAQEGD